MCVLLLLLTFLNFSTCDRAELLFFRCGINYKSIDLEIGRKYGRKCVLDERENARNGFRLKKCRQNESVSWGLSTPPKTNLRPTTHTQWLQRRQSHKLIQFNAIDILVTRCKWIFPFLFIISSFSRNAPLLSCSFWNFSNLRPIIRYLAIDRRKRTDKNDNWWKSQIRSVCNAVKAAFEFGSLFRFVIVVLAHVSHTDTFSREIRYQLNEAEFL